MDTRPVLFDETVSNALVEAVLHLRLTAEQVVAAEAAWAPHRALLRAEHSHWDWQYKSGFLIEPGVRCLGVECAGQVQGMMLLRESGYTARLAPENGQPLVYVDYLETAPWNLRERSRRYAGVGQLLLREAVRRSGELGYHGRLGLHSLPQVQLFYEWKCGMVGCGPDPGYYGLVYFEFTAERGTAFAED